jgi:glycosyltransferase involved in cell wall biosynthesis
LATLSVCIVTYNEEANIDKTLQAISFADEIVIIDSHSTDNTVEICKKYTNKIFYNQWQGCGIQKKLALEKATMDWVLILDADEILTKNLQQEIQSCLTNPKDYSGFIIPFQTFYLGKQIKFGDWYNETHLRLFKRNCGEITPTHVHFGLKVSGKIGKLQHRIMHYSFPNVETILNKMNHYSSLGATDKFKALKTANIFTALLHGIFTFIRGYILRLGFLDGKYGLMLAISNAEGSYYKYVKLMLCKEVSKIASLTARNDGN